MRGRRVRPNLRGAFRRFGLRYDSVEMLKRYPARSPRRLQRFARCVALENTIDRTLYRTPTETAEMTFCVLEKATHIARSVVGAGRRAARRGGTMIFARAARRARGRPSMIAATRSRVPIAATLPGRPPRSRRRMKRLEGAPTSRARRRARAWRSRSTSSKPTVRPPRTATPTAVSVIENYLLPRLSRNAGYALFL